MKIGFYITNKTIASVNCSDLYKGNPGIGGSEYAMFGLLNTLCENYNNLNYEYKLYINKEQKLPSSIKDITLVNNFENSINKANDDGVDLLIFKHNSLFIQNNIFEKYVKNRLKLVVWAHNFITRRFLNYYANSNNISRIINVSFEQMDLYRDHLAFVKSTSIYNGMYVNKLNSGLSLEDRPNEVTYVGSIIKAKGFHLLAKSWKKILESFPNAKLNVIGSGKLYNRDQTLGKFGIAEKSYEKQFIPYLVDNNGNLLKSVFFYGVLGHEKNQILKRTKIGVPNPSGETETFGYTAVEMQSFGSIVTTKKTVGYNETVFDRKSLYQNEGDLANYIINLLSSDSKYSTEEVHKFVEKKFDFSVVSKKWIELFERIKNDSEEPITPIYVKSLKYSMIEFNRVLKKNIPFGFYFIPSYLDFKSLIFKIRNI